jgi:hypothetical protein
MRERQIRRPHRGLAEGREPLRDVTTLNERPCVDLQAAARGPVPVNAARSPAQVMQTPRSDVSGRQRGSVAFLDSDQRRTG